MIQKIPIDELATDCGTQMRVEINQDTVDQYTELMRDGVEFPPLDVFCNGGDTQNIVAAGFHRLGAHRALKHTEVPCKMHEGGQDDAIWFAIHSNAAHGSRLRSDDYRKSVHAALLHPNAEGMSAEAIASHAGVCARYVRTVRKAMEERGELTPKKTAREKAAEALADPANEGKSNREIAEDAGVSEATVRGAQKRNSSENAHDEDEPDTKAGSSNEPLDAADDFEPLQLEEDDQDEVVDPDQDEDDPCDTFTLPEDPMEVPVVYARLENLEASVRELVARWPQEMSRSLLVKKLEICLELSDQ